MNNNTCTESALKMVFSVSCDQSEQYIFNYNTMGKINVNMIETN